MVNLSQTPAGIRNISRSLAYTVRLADRSSVEAIIRVQAKGACLPGGRTRFLRLEI